jgi:hypothetical protein
MTGGHARTMRKFMKHDVAAVDQELVYKGMALLTRQDP